MKTLVDYSRILAHEDQLFGMHGPDVVARGKAWKAASVRVAYSAYAYPQRPT